MDIDLATGDDLQSATSEAFQLAIDTSGAGKIDSGCRSWFPSRLKLDGCQHHKR